MGKYVAVIFGAILLADLSPAQSQNAAPGTPSGAVAGAGAGQETAPSRPRRLWQRLEEDGIHDPANPALPLLQQPEEALAPLPRDVEGNYVNWVKALREGAIHPRTNIYPDTRIQVLDLDILFEETAGMPMVRFPHRPHTEWLDCTNCHDRIFRKKKGANPVNMLAILNGQFCGQCHGAVSFPLTECFRCHNTPRPHQIVRPPEAKP